MIEVLVKIILRRILVHVIVRRSCKIGEYVDIKNCLGKKRLFGKLVLISI